MSRQRKVVITVTYNDLGIIVDTKAEDLDLSTQPPTTTWIGSYSPYTCKCCGFHVDSMTKYCPECGRKAVPRGGEDDAT